MCRSNSQVAAVQWLNGEEPEYVLLNGLWLIVSDAILLVLPSRDCSLEIYSV